VTTISTSGLRPYESDAAPDVRPELAQPAGPEFGVVQPVVDPAVPEPDHRKCG
jgi:hypothetical protein